ncbi:unnamed protein product, partial [Iphiclides podalirius]
MSIGTVFEKAYRGDYNQVKVKIDEDKSLIHTNDSNGRLLIHWAALGGNENLVDLLINLGSPLDPVDDTNSSPIILAASAGKYNVVKLLIDRGANVNHKTYRGQTPLHYACSKGHKEIAKLLIDSDARINEGDVLGATPLHRAASQGRSNIVEILIEDPLIKVDTCDSTGCTPLHLACEEDREAVACMLVNAGASIDTKNKEEKSPSIIIYAASSMPATYYDYYDGSKVFVFVSTRLGLPVDLVNFLIAQIAALCLARLFRKPLRLASPEFRHSVCLVIGLLMGYFCFGKQAVHLSVLPMLSYILLKTLPNRIMGNVILTVSMLYLSCLHLHRQLYHTADYTLDITGPVMVITQRVTSLAYLLQDNFARSEVGSNHARGDGPSAKVDKTPSPLEYFAYTLAFQTLMCGPVVFYSDYIKFIEGAEIDAMREKTTDSEPSPRRAVLYKVAGSVAAAVLYLTLAKKYPLTILEELTDPASEVSRSWSALYLLWYAYLSTLVVRCKYYHAWLLSEAICNNSGMGFNGYDADGTPKWDKMSNIDVFGFEFAQNFRAAVASWNKNTNAWLRGVAYERGGRRAGIARVYALSAIWHGFHPGYYLTFFAGGLFTVAAKKVRAVIRPMFLDSRPKKFFYDLLTFITTRIAMTYATVPFVLLHLAPNLAFYGKFYYSLHFIALGALLLPSKRKSLSNGTSTNELSQASSKDIQI